MNTHLQPPGSKKQPVTNPFARALAETEQHSFGQSGGPTDTINPFNDALARTSGAWDSADAPPATTADTWQAEQQRIEDEQRKLAMRRRLHEQINPVGASEVYNQRQLQVKKEIDKLREELKLLARDVSKFYKEVDITLMTEVSDPGEDGKYYLTFFQKLRAFIAFLRQKIKSAGTWATTLQSKGKKKRKKGGAGLDSKGHEKTSAVQDMMHHERSSTYSGG